MRPNGVKEPASTQSRWIFSITARNSGAAADSSPELMTYKVPVSWIHRAALNGRMPVPETACRRAGTPTQARDRAMVIRTESAARPSRWISAAAASSSGEEPGRASASLIGSPSRWDQRHTALMSWPSRAAACISAAIANTAFSIQNCISPDPSTGPVSADAVRIATCGSRQSATISARKVDSIPPMPSGLNTWTGPSCARSRRSARTGPRGS